MVFVYTLCYNIIGDDMTKTKRKIKWKNLVLIIVFIVLLFLFIYSSINVIKWFIDKKQTESNLQKIESITEVKEIDDSKQTEIIENDVDKSNPYWDYIKVKLIDVDFKELKEINSDTVGWIKINGTNVNYPFVQAKDNSYYLNHSFDKKKNSAGWVFMDYRNNTHNNKNTIIYAHGRLDKSMFGSLRNILKSNWIKDSNNFIIRISTEKENSLWQVFSAYVIPTTDDYIKTDFTSKDDFYNWAKMLLDRSQFDFNTTINKDDLVLTLSTCYNKTDKSVIHAKLIKREVKK
jgi:sortase B